MQTTMERPTTWTGWLRDPERARWLQTHPEDWDPALAAAGAFLTQCLERAGVTRFLAQHPGDRWDDWRWTAAECLWRALPHYDPTAGTIPMTYLMAMTVGYLHKERQARLVSEAGGLRITVPQARSGFQPPPVWSLQMPITPDDEDRVWGDLLVAPDDPAQQAVAAVSIREWLAQLPPKVAAAVRWRGQQDLTLQEIAERMGISHQWVAHLLREARRAYLTDTRLGVQS